MKKYGLIGYPLSHSFSKKYFTEKFEKEKISDAQYDLFPIENLKDFSALLHANPDLCGLNVTIPHKVDVIKYIDWVNEDAKQVGAINCIRVASESPVLAAFSGEVGIKGHDFRLEGFNTDVYGFEMSLKPLLKKQHTHALILGDGGAAKAVIYVLNKLGIGHRTVTRRENLHHILFKDLTKQHIQSHKIIINTTPVGTSPNIDECPPIPYEYITDEHLLYDLIYNPEQTLFLKKGEEKGAATKNGQEMLILQAEKAWEIWNSKAKHP
ncbi:shikimate dehydrogenase [Mucilaginibacter gynuensis]|uniref:Shikimate dehydrogenase n=1 Tax=Mucilaginibacter gynuensis TaxID=1302236 RepID=A0ABP8GTL5_9SPHI